MPPPARRLDRIVFLGARPSTTTGISWSSRELLVDRLETAGGAEDVIAAIRAPGTSRPVRLTRPQKRRLLVVLEGWLEEVGVPGLPERIVELRQALLDEADAGELDTE